jgi:phosphate transport system protein
MSTQTRAILDEQLGLINDELQRLAAMVDAAIEQSMDSLRNRDIPLAESVIKADEQINALRYQIEENCIRIVATQQPAASDLRQIMAAMIIASEIERMGDHAEGVARIVVRMGDEPLLKPLIDLPRMAQAARDMLSSAIIAFQTKNVELAKDIAGRDVFVDDLYKQIFRELITYIIEDPQTVTRALFLLFAAHNIERIADRVTNLAERTVFVASGELRELSRDSDEAKIPE